MDSKDIVGKVMIWTGKFADDEGYFDTYLLFKDMSGVVIPDAQKLQEPTFLANAKDVLSTIVSETFEGASSVMELAAYLEHPMFKAWAEHLDKLHKAKEEAEAAQVAPPDEVPAAVTSEPQMVSETPPTVTSEVTYPITEVIEEIPVPGVAGAINHIDVNVVLEEGASREP